MSRTTESAARGGAITDAAASNSVSAICAAAKVASRVLASASSEQKDRALAILAELIEQRAEQILGANQADLSDPRAIGLEPALLDRLELNAARVAAIAAGVRAVIALADPVGEVLEARTIEAGVELEMRRVPIGVVAVVYEARPNVTIDCAALCLKSGNAIVLRGSSYAARSNRVLSEIVVEALHAAGLPADAVALLDGADRAEMAELVTQDGVVDLVIPRGGEGLKNALKEVATVPVIYAASGNCHVYVDLGADLGKALAIILNAKTQRPGVCNAAETLLVHRGAAADFLPEALAALSEAGVELVGDEATRALAAPVAVGRADEEDYRTEYHALKLCVAVVASLDAAIAHVNRYGSGHSDAIVTGSPTSAQRFAAEVDSACVYINASTRFTDGFVFGLGAEIGNSTQKLHARGPIGLRELCTYKYVLSGDGAVRG